MSRDDSEDEPKTVLIDLPGCPRRLCADIDGSSRTVTSADSEVVSLFAALAERLRSVGSSEDPAAPTAATLAALTEARRVRPRTGTWVAEDPRLGPRFRLPPPLESLPAPLGDVLAFRRSVRRFGPLDPGDLATLLYHGARVHDLLPAEDGYPATTRAAPSAGARHPIDVIVVPAAEDLIAAPPEARSVAYLFDPLTCELVGLPPEEALPFEAVPQTSEELLGCRPPVTLVLGARLHRTFSRYRGGLSLVYRDAGAVIAVVAVVASALRLSCCALATPCARSGCLGRWVDVGGIALGGAAA